jgi:hypothetical protein
MVFQLFFQCSRVGVSIVGTRVAEGRSMLIVLAVQWCLVLSARRALVHHLGERRLARMRLSKKAAFTICCHDTCVRVHKQWNRVNTCAVNAAAFLATLYLTVHAFRSASCAWQVGASIRCCWRLSVDLLARSLTPALRLVKSVKQSVSAAVGFRF